MYAVKDNSDCLQLFFPLDYCGILRPSECGLQLYLLSFVGFLKKHMWSGRAFSVQKSFQCEVSSRWAKRDPVASSFFLGSCTFLSEELTLMVSICLRRPRVCLNSTVFIAVALVRESCLSGLCCIRRGNVLHHASSVRVTTAPFLRACVIFLSSRRNPNRNDGLVGNMTMCRLSISNPSPEAGPR